MATAGKDTRVKVSTTSGGSFAAVAGIKSANMELAGNNIDVSKFGDDFVSRIQGLKDATYSLDGQMDGTDTTGQNIVRSAYLNDTALFVQFLGDGTAGFQHEVKVAKYAESSAVDGVVEVSIDLEGTGAITTV
jgi:predicted secreted protein